MQEHNAAINDRQEAAAARVFTITVKGAALLALAGVTFVISSGLGGYYEGVSQGLRQANNGVDLGNTTSSPSFASTQSPSTQSPFSSSPTFAPFTDSPTTQRPTSEAPTFAPFASLAPTTAPTVLEPNCTFTYSFAEGFLPDAKLTCSATTTLASGNHNRTVLDDGNEYDPEIIGVRIDLDGTGQCDVTFLQESEYENPGANCISTKVDTKDGCRIDLIPVEESQEITVNAYLTGTTAQQGFAGGKSTTQSFCV